MPEIAVTTTPQLHHYVGHDLVKANMMRRIGHSRLVKKSQLGKHT